jgi:putative tryptophan/tyrosine transport system substrate-binding protein
MRRREFITPLGGAAAAWPLAARAQQGSAMRRVGALLSGAENDPEIQALLAAFHHELEKRGWSEGRNVRFDTRFASSPERFQPLANELVVLQPDVILAHSTPVVAAVRRESRTIPVVFGSVSDPIGSGFVASLARPGGNLTGFSLYEDGIIGKWLAVLREIAPRLTRAAIIANPKATPYDYFLQSADAAASRLAIELVPYRVENGADIERAIESFARLPNGGLVFPADTTSDSNRDLIVALAARHHLPAVYPRRLFVTAGGLMFYGVDRVEQFRQMATYVDRILRGEKPGDLPVQGPTKYELVINLKTAMVLGLTVPPSLLAIADEVID